MKKPPFSLPHREGSNKYEFIFIFIYEWQSVGGYGILAIPTLT